MTASYAFQVLEGAGVVLERYEGEVTISFIESSLQTLARDPAFRPGFDAVVDLRRCRLAASPGEMARLAEVRDAIWTEATGRTAVLASSARETGLSLLVPPGAVLRQTRIFSTTAAAASWLGRPESQLLQRP